MQGDNACTCVNIFKSNSVQDKIYSNKPLRNLNQRDRDECLYHRGINLNNVKVNSYIHIGPFGTENCPL